MHLHPICQSNNQVENWFSLYKQNLIWKIFFFSYHPNISARTPIQKARAIQLLPKFLLVAENLFQFFHHNCQLLWSSSKNGCQCSLQILSNGSPTSITIYNGIHYVLWIESGQHLWKIFELSGSKFFSPFLKKYTGSSTVSFPGLAWLAWHNLNGKWVNRQAVCDERLGLLVWGITVG